MEIERVKEVFNELWKRGELKGIDERQTAYNFFINGIVYDQTLEIEKKLDYIIREIEAEE